MWTILWHHIFLSITPERVFISSSCQPLFISLTHLQINCLPKKVLFWPLAVIPFIQLIMCFTMRWTSELNWAFSRIPLSYTIMILSHVTNDPVYLWNVSRTGVLVIWYSPKHSSTIFNTFCYFIGPSVLHFQKDRITCHCQNCSYITPKGSDVKEKQFKDSHTDRCMQLKDREGSN